jgi:hypothetical protein
MKRILTDKSTQKSRNLFAYEDKRARYLVEERENKMPLVDVFHMTIDWKEPFFWANLPLCTLEIARTMIRKGVFVKISRETQMSPRAHILDAQ